MVYLGIYLGIGLIWIIVLEYSIYTLPDDDLDTTTVILNLLLWPMIIVYLLEELRKLNNRVKELEEALVDKKDGLEKTD